MPKRKKHPKLPNGYGSIKYLGKNRRNPYAVHPPVTEYTDEGVPITPKALCYVDDWMKGFIVLTSYRAGTYTKGDERDIILPIDQKSLEIIAQRLLSDYNKAQGIAEEEKRQKRLLQKCIRSFGSINLKMKKERNYLNQANVRFRQPLKIPKLCTTAHLGN